MKTIRRNATRKLNAMLDAATYALSFNSDNYYRGQDVNIDYLRTLVNEPQVVRPKFYTETHSAGHKTRGGETHLTISIHSRLWYEVGIPEALAA